MNVAWKDLGGVTEAGCYPFHDGTIDVLAIEIAHWKNIPKTFLG
jgi:hypothetical protein